MGSATGNLPIGQLVYLTVNAVFGWTKPGDSVDVLTQSGATVTATVGDSGYWAAFLPSSTDNAKQLRVRGPDGTGAYTTTDVYQPAC
jgi:hypothetical protein